MFKTEILNWVFQPRVFIEMMHFGSNSSSIQVLQGSLKLTKICGKQWRSRTAVTQISVQGKKKPFKKCNKKSRKVLFTNIYNIYKS